MNIESIRTLSGPNVFSYRPVLLMRLDLEELYDRESCEFEGFNQRLLTLLPNLKSHHCALGQPGGFVTRLEEGTYFGHIVEHVALELTDLCGIAATHGKTRHDEGHVYNVAIEYKAERAGGLRPQFRCVRRDLPDGVELEGQACYGCHRRAGRSRRHGDHARGASCGEGVQQSDRERGPRPARTRAWCCCEPAVRNGARSVPGDGL